MTSVQQVNPWTPELIKQDEELKAKYGQGAHIIPSETYVVPPSAVSAVQQKYAPDTDTVDFSNHETSCSALSKSDKQQIKYDANKKASGLAIFGGPFATLYYALRSDKTIAKKYNLDVDADKEFIKEIKKSQTLWTVPGACLPLAGGLAAYIYNNCQNVKDIKVDN